ncbi:inactive CLIP domain-containing serine protease A3-like [Cotesia typhae]
MKKMTMMHKLTVGQVEVGEYPWQVVILKKRQYDTGYTYISTGVLINKKHVLTAVHEIDLVDISDLIIRLGEWDLLSNEEICSEQDYHPIKIIKHPGYNIHTLENNIALIILDRIVPLATSPHINTVCVHSGPIQLLPSLRRCWVAGWGSSQPLAPATKRLRNVNIPIVNRTACQQSFQKILGNSYQLPENILCAGEGKMDPCIMDEGAPLVCQSVSGEMNVVGLVSASTGCQKNVPSLFTDVSKFTSWIHQQVFEHY